VTHAFLCLLLFMLLILRPRRPTLFPYTTLFRSPSRAAKLIGAREKLFGARIRRATAAAQTGETALLQPRRCSRRRRGLRRARARSAPRPGGRRSDRADTGQRPGRRRPRSAAAESRDSGRRDPTTSRGSSRARAAKA